MLSFFIYLLKGVHTLMFYLIMILSGMFVVIVLFPLSFIRSGAFFMMRAWATVSLWGLRVFCGVETVMENMQVLSTVNGQYCNNIIACKHQSALEILIILKNIPKPVFFLKHTIMYVPLVNVLLIKTGQLVVRRGLRNNSFLINLAKKRLKDSNIIIFPEGTRKDPFIRNDKYHTGAVILGKQTETDIVPMSTNAGVLWARKRFAKNPGKAIVRCLTPIPMTMQSDLRKSLGKMINAIEDDTQKLVENT